MSGEKETPKQTTNDNIKGASVVTSSYDWLDPEKMESQLASTQNYLKSKSEDFTAFDAKKGNANLAIQARYKAYKDKLDKALQAKDSKKYAQLYDSTSKVTNVLEKNKLAEQYGLKNPDFYVDQKTVLGKDFDDYVKTRNYVGEMYGYKNLGIDVEKDKHGSRMSVQDVTPRQSTRASQFINTGTQSSESNNTREESFDQDITYNLDTKTYGIKFTNPLVQERIETRLRPNPTEQGVGFKGMKAGKGAEFQDAAQAQKEAQAAKKALNTNIVKDLPKKRRGTDNTIPKLEAGTQGLTGDQYAGLAAGTAQIAGGVVEATDTQKNGKKSVGGAALTGAASGAAMGASVGGPWGAAIGGVFGGVKSVTSAAIGNKKIDKQMEAQAVRDAEAKKLAMFTPMKNTQAPMYAKGTAGAVNNKPVEVEKDEMVFRKGADGSFAKVADFKGGKTHEQGGEPYLLKVGDVVFPGHKRDLINSYLSKRDFAAIDRERQKLPKEVPGTKKLDNGWGGEEYTTDTITGMKVKVKDTTKPAGTGTVLRPKEQTTIKAVVKPKPVEQKKPALSFSATPKPGQYGFNTIEEEGLPTSTNAKLKLKTDVALPSTTTLATRAPQTTAINTKEPKDNSLAIQKGLAFAAPISDVIRGMGAAEKTTRRFISPEEIQYSDKSAGLRQEAAIADRVRRGNTSTSAQQNRANAGISSAMKSRDMQNIGASETARADQIAAMNVGIRNQAKQQNLELANRYDEQDLQNKAVRDSYGRAGLRGISDTAQQHMQDAAMTKRDLMIAENLLGERNYAYSAKDGLYFIRNADGTISTSKTKPAVG